ncbi:MAG: transcriptional repressor [Candidatus Zixiibacteriota bacterium]
MREFLRTKGFKMTPQRELIFRSFFELGKHVSVDELYAKVRTKDRSVGYATVWRNLKLICKVGLAEEVNIGDGITRYDRVTKFPHGHLYCTECKSFTEFDARALVESLTKVANSSRFEPELFKIEVLGVCAHCSKQAETRHRRQSH